MRAATWPPPARVLVLALQVLLLAGCGGGTAPGPPGTGPGAPVGTVTSPATAVVATISARAPSPTSPSARATGAAARTPTTGHTPTSGTATATGRAEPAPPVAFRPAPWSPGEATIYDIESREGGRNAGGATYTLARESGVDTLSAVIAIGATEDRFEIGFDSATLRPVSELRTVIAPAGRVDLRAEYHDGGATVETIARGATQRNLINLPPVYYANEQFLWILRALPFAEGYRGALTIVSSQGDPATVATTVAVIDQETVVTPLGPRRAWRVEARFADVARPQLLWYGVEAPHYLLKYDNGRFVFVLSRVE